MVLFVRLTFEHLQNFKHSKGDGEGDGYSSPKLQQLPTDSLVSSETLATYTPHHPDCFTASPDIALFHVLQSIHISICLKRMKTAFLKQDHVLSPHSKKVVRLPYYHQSSSLSSYFFDYPLISSLFKLFIKDPKNFHTMCLVDLFLQSL